MSLSFTTQKTTHNLKICCKFSNGYTPQKSKLKKTTVKTV